MWQCLNGFLSLDKLTILPLGIVVSLLHEDSRAMGRPGRVKLEKGPLGLSFLHRLRTYSLIRYCQSTF
jgi:hypothetical protein